jgi:translation initiation factor 2 alpha subunit (eIF-2alpha)
MDKMKMISELKLLRDAAKNMDIDLDEIFEVVDYHKKETFKSYVKGFMSGTIHAILIYTICILLWRLFN